MKVCFVSAFPPSKGNLAEFGSYLAKGLSKEAEIGELVIIADRTSGSEAGGAVGESASQGKVRIVRSWESNRPLSFIGILSEVRRESPDVVLFSCSMTSWGASRAANFFGSLLPFVTGKLLRKKVVVCLHNMVETVDFGEFERMPNRVELFAASLATRLLLSADKVVVTLGMYKDLLASKYRKSNIVHIPHGTLGYRKAKQEDDGRTILTFGFWRETKNLPLLLDAFEDLKKENGKLRLVVAGQSHPHFEGYIEGVRKSHPVPGVDYLGYVPEGKLDDVFWSATIVVLPYLTMVGSSGVVHLAASYGKPVVMTDINDIRRTIEEEDLKVVLFKKNDKEGLERAIRSLLKDPGMRKSMEAHNGEVAERLSFDKIADRYVDLFRSLGDEGEKSGPGE